MKKSRSTPEQVTFGLRQTVWSCPGSVVKWLLRRSASENSD